MSLQYSRSLLRVVIAQLCQQLGWNAIQSSPLELLTDILERYILQLGCQAHRFSELCMLKVSFSSLYRQFAAAAATTTVGL